MATVENLLLLNTYTATGSGLLLIATAILLLDLYTKRRLVDYVEKWGMYAALGVTLFGTIMTLVYSEVFGVIPCALCWFERMMLYPQVLIVLTALYLKDKFAPKHGIVLSTVGLVIALYHHYIQMGGSELFACPTSGGDCSKRLVFEYGFVTFPMMAAILFAFLIVLYLYILKTRTNSFRMVE